jgi:hypothetical protein
MGSDTPLATKQPKLSIPVFIFAGGPKPTLIIVFLTDFGPESYYVIWSHIKAHKPLASLILLVNEISPPLLTGW